MKVFYNLILLMILISCSKNGENKLIEKTDVLGTWRTIENTDIATSNNFRDDSGITVEWGAWYIMDFELKPNGVLDLKTNNYGHWEIDEIKGKLYIYDSDKKSKLHEFDISIDNSGQLVLTDNYQILKHKRLD